MIKTKADYDALWDNLMTYNIFDPEKFLTEEEFRATVLKNDKSGRISDAFLDKLVETGRFKSQLQENKRIEAQRAWDAAIPPGFEDTYDEYGPTSPVGEAETEVAEEVEYQPPTFGAAIRGAKWVKAEESWLKKNLRKAKKNRQSWKDIAESLGRSVSSIRSKVSRIKAKKKK